MSLYKSASLIFLKSIKSNLNKQNFQLLLNRRNTESRSFAGQIVFPGGHLDKSDYKEEWQKLIDTRACLGNKNRQNENSLYTISRSLSNIIPEVFFRICAIRETFEETGILLAVDKHQESILSNQKLSDDIRLNNWQKKVIQNPESFIDLFQTYNIAPDLLSLYEWEEWVTPLCFPRRFHTAFFICFKDIQQINLYTDLNESSFSIWITPQQALDDFKPLGQLAPPQFFQLNELSSFPSWQQLEFEMIKRQNFGCTHNFPVLIKLSNGTIVIFPGDSRYPQSTNLDTIIDLRPMLVQDLSGDKYFRRYEFGKDFKTYQCNVTTA